MKLALITILSLIGTWLTAGNPSQLELAGNGKPKAVIVIPDREIKLSPQPPEKGRPIRYAAEFLQKYLRDVTGATLPIVTEKDAPAENFIAVGDTKTARAWRINPEKLPNEGYVIKSGPGGIVICGEIAANGLDRGTMFGVFQFLETFAGVRWYFPGKLGTVIPKRKNLGINLPVDIRRHPFFKVRYGGMRGSEWYPVLRYGITAGKVANHTEYPWKRLYGKTHPEYFGKDRKGKSCLEKRGPLLHLLQ